MNLHGTKISIMLCNVQLLVVEGYIHRDVTRPVRTQNFTVRASFDKFHLKKLLAAPNTQQDTAHVSGLFPAADEQTWFVLDLFWMIRNERRRQKTAAAVGEASALAGGRRVKAGGVRCAERRGQEVCKQMAVNKVMISN